MTSKLEMEDDTFQCPKCGRRLFVISWKESLYVEAYKYKQKTHRLGYYCRACHRLIPIGNLKIGLQSELIFDGVI